ncbi:hypothetical protein C7974DRAFT_95377 [Boeremia exigua]|uniref:uncharacterized protein n=1 Tax=Boeremia exigua TaxID=749465 RepID=UPI001E8DFBAE|nr:uncharacterized protein C7974DRAFT_95377 [Boeremia exigua]KAH6642104.1 hypothetical protein C7974DRAFT_95377 [Boeremia exigua]
MKLRYFVVQFECTPHLQLVFKYMFLEPLRTDYSLHDGSITVVISGFCDQSWYGYAFGSMNRSDDTEEYLYDSGDFADVDESTSDKGSQSEDFFEPDFFATDGREPFAISPDTIWDPRVYFLQTIRFRLEITVQANEYLVRKLEDCLEAGKTKTSKTPSLSGSLESILVMMKLLSRVRDQFQEANQVWNRFSASDGDIMYFVDLSVHDVCSVLHEIEESFDRMKCLELQVERLVQKSEIDIHNLRLQMADENNRLSWEGNVLSRTKTKIDVQATENAARSAARSSAAAEETSRTTRVNIQLFMITASIVIALQYFCSDRALFSFERNTQTFFISIAVLIPSLLLLTYLLRAIDVLRDVILSRLSGQIATTSHSSFDWDCSARASDEKNLHEKHGKLV